LLCLVPLVIGDKGDVGLIYNRIAYLMFEPIPMPPLDKVKVGGIGR
jgi:hypothetical protein